MRRSRELLAGISLAAASTLGATACTGSTHNSSPANLACVGLEFTTPKGGPGMIQIDVYPKFNRDFGDARPMSVSGQVISGNDTGSTLTGEPEGGYGKFTFTWDTSSTAIQRSVIAAQVEFQYVGYSCPDTTLEFEPSTYAITPHLPNSPY